MKGQPLPLRVILRAYGEEYICKLMPEGWSDNSSSWTFDWNTFGHNVKYSTDTLRFVLEDANWIRQQLDKHAVSTEIDVIIQKCQNNWTYADIFHGQIDFSANYINDSDFVEVSVLEGGFKRALAENGKTNYEIGFDEDSIEIDVPEGIQLFERAKYDFSEQTSAINSAADNGASSHRKQFLRILLDNSNSFIRTKGLLFLSQNVDESTSERTSILITKKITPSDAEVIGDIKARIVGILRFNNQSNNVDLSKPISIYVNKKNITSGQVEKIYLTSLGSGYFNNNEVFKIDKIIDITPSVDSDFEYEIYSEHYVMTTSSFRNWFWFTGSISIEYFGNINTGAFKLKAYDVEKFGNKLLNKTYEDSEFKAPILDFLPTESKLFITTADAIRGIPEKARIKTNFVEFNRNLDCLLDIGTVTNNSQSKYEIAHKAAIFNPNNKLIDLGQVKELQVKSVSDEWLYNVINSGYEKQKYNYPLGRQDFAFTLEHANELKIPNKKMDLICKYRADFTGVHLLRYDYINANKKDSNSDNDVFFILAFKKMVDRTIDVISDRNASVIGVYRNVGDIVNIGDILMELWEYNQNPPPTMGAMFCIYSPISGVVSEIKNIAVGTPVQAGTLLMKIKQTEQAWQAIIGDDTWVDPNTMEGGGYFNILLSPHRNLQRHDSYLRSMLWKHNKVLTYVSSTETMSNMISDYRGNEVEEKSDLVLPVGNIIFKPVIFEFNTIIPQNLTELLGDSPCGYIQFKWNNLDLKGFPINIQGSTTSKSQQKVTLIAHPDTPDDIQYEIFWKSPRKLY